MKFFLSKNTPTEESRVGLSRPTGRKVVGKVWRTDAGKAEALIELNRNDVRPDGFLLKTTRKFLVFSSTTSLLQPPSPVSPASVARKSRPGWRMSIDYPFDGN